MRSSRSSRQAADSRAQSRTGGSAVVIELIESILIVRKGIPTRWDARMKADATKHVPRVAALVAGSYDDWHKPP